ncbi:hypothetical protein M3Y99_01848600 [Aphelenchoides fujianensis]|nr:hypothetical protein M3Y99_01848600 [Aphelenchoides fujianensis]
MKEEKPRVVLGENVKLENLSTATASSVPSPPSCKNEAIDPPTRANRRSSIILRLKPRTTKEEPDASEPEGSDSDSLDFDVLESEDEVGEPDEDFELDEDADTDDSQDLRDEQRDQQAELQRSWFGQPQQAAWWMCPHCRQWYSPTSRTRHERTCLWSPHVPEELPCEHCGRLIMRRNMPRHLQAHEKHPGFKCDLCGVVCKTKKLREQHKRDVHFNDRHKEDGTNEK